MDDVAMEIGKLQEQLRLCRLELAHVRHQQELAAEATTSSETAKRKLRQLTTRLDRRLASGESVGGARGWMKRRVLSTMPRPDENGALAVLRTSKLMNGPWYFRAYPEVVSTGLSPALHYLRHGAAEGKNPGPAFKTTAYVAREGGLPDGVNPLVHFHATHPGTSQ